jgi:hypothetical protein
MKTELLVLALILSCPSDRNPATVQGRVAGSAQPRQVVEPAAKANSRFFHLDTTSPTDHLRHLHAGKPIQCSACRPRPTGADRRRGAGRSSADEKNILGLTGAINDLADRARAKQLKPEDVQGGTFTITNPGVFGALFGMPIISQPQVAILGVGAVEKRPVIVDDAIAIRHRRTSRSGMTTG